MIHNQAHQSTIKVALPTFALLALLLALALPQVAAQSDSDPAYVIRANLPQAAVHDLSIKIIIPPGMVFDAQSLTASGAASAPAVTVGSPNDGSAETQVQADYGDVDNTNNQDLLITFRSLVADVASVANGAVLPPIRAALAYRPEDGELRSYSGEMEGVTVIEPDLLLERSFSPASGRAGGEIGCTLRISHTSSSTAPAYDVSIQDALPASLEYVPGSLEIISGPPGLARAASPGASFPQVDGSWSGEQKVEVSYMARIAEDAGLDNLTCRADLDWTSTAGENPAERTYHKSAEGLILLSAPAPDLQISLSDSPDPIAPGGLLHYVISYQNTGGPGSGAKVEAAWDPDLAFLSAHPAPDQGSQNSWSLGDLQANSSGQIEVSLQAADGLSSGKVLTSSARISAAAGQAAQSLATTTVSDHPSRLTIQKSADAELIRPGGILNYSITYANEGEGPADNLSVTDIVDGNLFYLAESGSPPPSRVWSEGDGTHLLWNASALSAQSLAPGESGSITLTARLPETPAHPNFDWVTNRYKIDSVSSSGSFQSLQTAVVHSLWVRKKADRENYMRGETINYTITYGNELALEARQATVTDILPDVEFLEADPAPGYNNGSALVWNLGTLPPSSSGTIQLFVRINKSLNDIIYQDSQSVSGEGYMQRHQDLSTARRPKTLTNYVRIDAFYNDLPDSDNSSATIGLLDALGTEAKLRGHGSGSYAREEETLLKTNNSTISLTTSLSAKYRPSSFSLPGGQEIGYTSKWHDATQSKNRITDSSTTESYSHASRLDRSSTLHLDKNGSTLESETTFEGAGSIGLLKGTKTNHTTSFAAADPAFESREDYLGSFTVYTKYDEYGKSVTASRSASGTGFASSDKRVSDRQRSYEYGTGSYSVEDEIQTQTNYMAKEINASHAPTSFSYTPRFQVNLSSKWNEGMWSRSGSPLAGESQPASFISEEFDQLDYLQKSSVASGLNQMNTEADFQGRARFTAQYQNLSRNRSDQLDLYDEYLGRYSITRDVEIGGVASFDQPHLSISKEGSMEPAGGTFIDYTITVKNDGNRALGPVYVQDLFPPQTEYIGSSLRPSESTAASCQWTLQSLGIGQSSAIELKLNSTAEQAGLVNRVLASGGYDGQWVKAENYSALQYGWLDCCPSQLLAAKTARVDSGDPTLIHYQIRLKNRENYSLALTIIDQLPEGISFVNSTTPPAGRTASSLTWNMVDLQPGGVRTLDYMARAHRSGVFSAPAHIDASALDGPQILSADISAQVYVPGEFASSTGSDWQPPACFALNCTTQGPADNWIPCTACSAAGLENIETECSSCGQVDE